MKYFFIFLTFMVFNCKSTSSEVSTNPTTSLGYLTETDHFKFYSPYWLNMHHFLHHQILHGGGGEAAIFDAEVLEQLSVYELETVRKTADYYQKHLIDLDLRSSDYMASFKEWVVRQKEDGFTEIPDSFQTHVSLLTAFDPLYLKTSWPKHQKTNQEVLASNLGLIQKTEKAAVKQLSQWTKTDWQKEKIRVDIVYFAKSSRGRKGDRPFTTLYPTHIVMNAIGHEVQGNWVELVYHESSHHLISPNSGFVSETLEKAGMELEKKVPRSLWHAYLFYFSGKVSQELLQMNGVDNYELYMMRNRVFSAYIPYLEKYIPSYLEGKNDLEAVSKSIIADYYKDQ